jgi:hypothetical protein
MNAVIHAPGGPRLHWCAVAHPVIGGYSLFLGLFTAATVPVPRKVGWIARHAVLLTALLLLLR